MKRIFVAVISLIAVVSVFGKDIYVSPSGGDSAAGTAEAPYLTIRKAMNQPRPARISIFERASTSLSRPISCAAGRRVHTMWYMT